MSDQVLCYWVRGKRLGCTTIKVLPNMIVGKLTELIAQRNGFPQVSVHLYKIPDDQEILDDDSMEEKLGSLSISLLGRPLRASQPLSKYFTPPIQPGRLHLIVNVVDIDVYVRCWYRGSDIPSSFTVGVPMDGFVFKLKTAIKTAQQKILADTPVQSLRLYKVPPSTTDDELGEILSTVGLGQLLAEKEALKTVFGDVPFSKDPMIIVQFVEIKKVVPPLSVHPPVMSEDPIAGARAAFLAGAPAHQPSHSGTPSSFMTWRGGLQFIPCGQPRDAKRDPEETIPSTLLHPVFGRFVDDCKSINPTAQDNQLAHELEITMSELYNDEVERADAVKITLYGYEVVLTGTDIEGTEYFTDGDMMVNGHRYVIAKFKNEAAGIIAEPYLQAIACYLESTRSFAREYSRSPLPCMLLVIFGPYIVFAGANWNLRPVVQVLSMPITFHFHSTDTESRLVVARHMAAFRRAIKTLEEYYRNLLRIPFPTNVPPPPQIFPYQTTYKLLDDNAGNNTAMDVDKKTFRYTAEVAEKKLVFFATHADDDMKICVKFVRAYSVEAHRELANAECAPKLLGFEEIAGGWFMVVYKALAGFETLDMRERPLPSSVFDDMSEKLAAFHTAGFVHGDIRDVNIMVSKRDETQFKFIGFNWSGKINEVRYPPLMDTLAIKRPPDALGGELIKAEHDDFMLGNVRRLKCGSG